MKILEIALQVFVITTLISLMGFYLAIRPIRIVSSISPSDFGLTFDEVTFKTQDNILLNGWYIPSEVNTKKTIILLHGYPADKGDILPGMAFLHKKYNLFLFDFRYFGKSGGHYSTAGKNEVLDLLAAIHYLKTRGINQVGVWGFSMGGAVAIMTAPQAPEIKAIVAESSYAKLSWMAEEYHRIPLIQPIFTQLNRIWARLFLNLDINSVSPVDALKQINIPILIIHSKTDEVISFRHGELLADTARHNPRAKVIVVEALRHGEHMSNYQIIIEQFFDQYYAELEKTKSPA